VKITAEPRSDQWNADDFLGGARTFTIAGAKKGEAEQPYDILLEGEARSWRPPLGMLRVLMQAWGDESDIWIGRRVTLYRDNSVRFGKEVLGGIRISHMSHIEKPMNFKVTTARGRRETYTVQPLPDVAPPSVPARDWKAEADNLAGNVEALRNLYMDAKANGATPDTLTHIQNKAQEPTE
jgi:hypothetical protein